MADQTNVLARMTWLEAEQALESARLAILPVGACEQHGPNMTLETDSAISYALAERLAERLYPQAILAPLMPWGVSPHHINFPGTITLRRETFDAVLRDVVTSLTEDGLTHFFFVNGHGGNIAPLETLCYELRNELGVRAASMMYLRLAADVVKSGTESELYGHACEVEASVGLFIAPHTVREERVKGEVKPYEHPHTDLYAEARLDYPFHFDELTSNGALGDARQATHEFGERIVQAALTRAVEFLESFLAEE